MLSHAQKAWKIHTFYRDLTTWEYDKSKNNDNVILGHLERYRVFIQPHLGGILSLLESSLQKKWPIDVGLNHVKSI